MRRTLSVAARIVLFLVLFFAVLIAVLRFALFPHADEFRPKLEALLSHRLGVTLRMQNLAADWQGLSPAITVTGLTIQPPDSGNATPALTIPRARAVGAWRSLLRFRPVMASLDVTGADLLVQRDAAGKLHIAGVPLTNHGGHSYAFNNWLLLQQTVVMHGVTVRWLDVQRDAPLLTIRDVDLAMLNRGRDHHLGVQARFDDKALGKLDFRADFRHAPLEELLNGEPMQRGNPRYWRGKAYLASGPVDLPTVSRYINLPIAANQGQTSLRGWIDFASGKIDGIAGNLTGSALALRVDPSLPPLSLPSVAMVFSAHRRDGESAVALRDVQIEVAGQSTLADGTPVDRMLHIKRFDGAYRAPAVGRGERIQLSGDLLDVGLLADISRALPLPQRLKRNINRYDPRGTLADYAAQWERQAPTTEAAASAARIQGDQALGNYQFSARLEGVSLKAQPPAPGVNAAGHPHIGRPGFHNLDGVIRADQEGGQLQLASSDVSLTVPGLFELPTLSFDTLKGEVNWRIAQNNGQPSLDARIPSMAFANPDANGTVQARFQANLHAAQEGRLDLSARLDRASVPAVPRYLPTSIGPQLRHYLAHAFSAGETRHATIEAHGRLPDLPYPHGPSTPEYPHGPSQFVVNAPFTGGKINLSPYPAILLSNGQPEQWPGFEGVGGRFFVDGAKLGFDVDKGHYKRITVRKAAGRIDNLASFEKPMIIDAEAGGPIADLLSFVNDSPLGFWSGHVTSNLHGEGNALLAMQLAIPRRRAADRTVVSVPIRTAAGPAAEPVLPATSLTTRAANPHPGGITVKGTLTFQRNRLVLNTLPALDDLSGSVAFTQRTAQSNGLRGRFLGGNVSATGKLRQEGDLDVQVNGTVDPHVAITESPDMNATAAKLLARLSGSAPYSLMVQRSGHAAPAVNLTSDLDGLGIDLPAPLQKRRGDKMPLSLNWRTVSEGSTQSGPVVSAANGAAASGNAVPYIAPNPIPTAVRSTKAPGMPQAPLQRLDLTVGPVRASYLRRGGETPEMIAGTIGINRIPAMPVHGVTATASFKQLNADAWRTVLADLRTKSPSRPRDTTPPQASRTGLASWIPERFDIDVDDLIVLSRHWNDVVLTGNRSDTRGWVGQIDSRQVAGSVEWQPQAGSALHARLSRLDVPPTDPTLTATHTPGPSTNDPVRHYPAIDLVADEFSVSNRKFGKLTLLAHNIDLGGTPLWQVDKLDFDMPAARLHANGSWRTEPGTRDATDPAFESALQFTLDIHDGGALLSQLGLPATLRGGKGMLEGALSWRGSPGSIDTTTLSGNLAVDLQKGQILKVNPGAARLLGVVSLQGLARFLQFDFKGLFGTGLAFDSLHGTAQVDRGIATVHDVALHTTPARVYMTGSTDIPRETQNLLVTVVPNVNAGSASIAAAVINPLLGLGSLVAQLALAEPISRSLTRQYAITGSWSAPHVQRQPVNRGNILPSANRLAP